MREDKQSLTDILEELIDHDYELLPEKTAKENIAQAKSQILEMFGEWVGSDKEVTPVEYDYKGLFCPYCNTAIPNEEVFVYNSAKQEIRNRVGENSKCLN
jgi:hypothetical protein